MTTAISSIREATLEDALDLAILVRTAYRGEWGWTTEASLLTDDRIDPAGVKEKITNPETEILVAIGDTGGIIGCCELVARGDGLAYFGMFAIDPTLQAAGLGRQMLQRAEQYAVATWHAHTMEMTVIAQRHELIDWYIRRGYSVSDETRPFPYDDLINGVALRPDLYFAVLTKSL